MLMEEEKERKRKEFWKNVKEGQVIYGFVKSITDYGAFIDLGGVDGFLYVNDITWGRITHPKEYLKLGDEVKVKVMTIDQEKHKVSVSIKDLKGDPWAHIEEKYPVGSRVKGKAVGVVEYGVFVELEPGLEGLLHVSEMSWDKKLRNPTKLVSKGDMPRAAGPGYRHGEEKDIPRSQTVETRPLEGACGKVSPQVSVVKGKVKNFTDFGLFIGMEDGIDGLVHISEVSWSRRKNVVADSYKKGATVDALVLNIDGEQKKFSSQHQEAQGRPLEGTAGAVSRRRHG